MNSKHLELYTILGEYDNTGFPLSYCLLSTATSVEDGKRTKALEAWGTILRDKYGLIPRFVHTDKDMGEIGMSKQVWPSAKHQLSRWHEREAVRKRLKGNLPTSPYNIVRAQAEYHFIESTFKPCGRTDFADVEGAVPGEVQQREPLVNNTNEPPFREDNPNSIKIRILMSQAVKTPASTSAPADCKPESLKIRIPLLSTLRDGQAPTSPENEESADEANTTRHTFCPLEHRDAVVNMMERHFCAHPLILGYSAPTPEGIKAWAVKQIYEFCVDHGLPNLWAYLWESWYRRGRWELWARSANPAEIPRLKTTMMVEAQYVKFHMDVRWCKYSHRYLTAVGGVSKKITHLHHFSLPRLDFLAWILIKKIGTNLLPKA